MKWETVFELVFWLAAFSCVASIINLILLWGADHWHN